MLLELFGFDPYELKKRGDFLFKENRFGEAKLEYEKALEIFINSSLKEEQELAKEINSHLDICINELVALHQEQAENYLEAEDYEKAASEYKFSIELAGENHSKITDLRAGLNKCRGNFETSRALSSAVEFIERARNFYQDESWSEAFVELKEAQEILGGVAEETNEYEQMMEILVEVEKKLALPYLNSAEQFIELKSVDEAMDMLEKAAGICQDIKNYSALKNLFAKARKLRAKSSSPEKNYVSKVEWDKAMTEYKLITDLYFKYSKEEANPYQPYFYNIYQDDFNRAKKNIGKLYIKRADGHFNDGVFQVAARYYNEAQKFLSETDLEYEYIKDQIEKCQN